jgi:hypothetical protein
MRCGAFLVLIARIYDAQCVFPWCRGTDESKAARNTMCYQSIFPGGKDDSVGLHRRGFSARSKALDQELWGAVEPNRNPEGTSSATE